MNWKGKTAIVTGASGGIGRAVCRKLASMKLNMVITGRNQESLDTLACELRGTGVDIVSCTGDITDSGFVRSLPTAAVERFGGLDVLINCAGTAQNQRFE